MAIEFSDKSFTVLENKYIDGGVADNVHVIKVPHNTTDALAAIEEKREGMVAFDTTSNQLVIVDNTGEFQSVSSGGTVASFNGRTGAVVPQSGDYDASEITYDNLTSGLSATDVQAAIDEVDAAKQPTIDGNYGNNSVLGTSPTGDLVALSNIQQDQTTNGLYYQKEQELTDQAANYAVNTLNLSLDPQLDSPNETYTLNRAYVEVDPNDTGFQIGTNGQSVVASANFINHQGTSDLGYIELLNQSFNIGNGTDPINFRGVGYAFGFGQIQDNVTITNNIQGYGFQPNLSSGVIVDPGAYSTAFYDNMNAACVMPGHTSANFSPNIAEVLSGRNITGVNINPSIPVFQDNAGYIGVGVYPNLGTFGANSYFQAININPTVTSARYAVGINVAMDNVTAYPGVSSSLVIQDLTITFLQPTSDTNSFQIQYVNDGTAGSETAQLAGQLITVHMQSGVSTADQIKAAIEANFTLNANLDVVVSGVGSNPQIAQVATNFTGGENAGNVKAAYFDGDVEITGALAFGGALSIGKLNAFATQALVDGGGNPGTIHGLISQPTVADNTTVANADILGVNTAMLLTIGQNSTVTTSFIGLAALGLPAVVSMGTGSTVDQVSGATFALSLDSSASGGTISNLDLCRALAIPNGVTSVTTMTGYKFDLPFGDPSLTTWGFYESPGVNNYFAGNLLIGGTAYSDDTVTNSSVALEIKSTTKALVNARMTSTERDALTALPGMVVYNTTTDKLQVYAAGVWVDLH